MRLGRGEADKRKYYRKIGIVIIMLWILKHSVNVSRMNVISTRSIGENYIACGGGSVGSVIRYIDSRENLNRVPRRSSLNRKLY